MARKTAQSKNQPKKAAAKNKPNNQSARNNDDRVLTAGFGYLSTVSQQSIRLVRANLEQVLVVFFLPLLVSVLGQVLANHKHDINKVIAGGLLSMIGSLWLLAGALCVYFYSLAIVGERPGFWKIYRRGLAFAPRVIGASILVVVIAVAGFICLIIPGFIAIRRYCLTPYYIVDYNIGIREALDKSAQSKPAAPAIYGVLSLIALLGVISLLSSIWLPVWGGIVSNIITINFLFVMALLYKAIDDLQA